MNKVFLSGRLTRDVEVTNVDTPTLLEQLARVVNVDKTELAQVILDLRLKTFEAEQAKLKATLIGRS